MEFDNKFMGVDFCCFKYELVKLRLNFNYIIKFRKLVDGKVVNY